ncbi:hypothetical protein MKZ02_22645 [Pseudobacillus sp. FSL P4-0506]|uniref:hypothetical protein n=1 Tax=Pseudobacillus sp. FSL P4-0506 TaxID=2921576 RepID=UPI0030FB335F
MFDVDYFRKNLKERIEKRKKTLKHYEQASDPHNDKMCELLKEEISTLNWTIKETHKETYYKNKKKERRII